MYSSQSFEANYSVELLQNFVQTIDNIIPGIEDMASIQADPHFFGKLYAVENGTQFLKATANFTSLARHGL